MEGIALLVVCVLAAFVGAEVVSRAAYSEPDLPLLAGAATINGVVLVGAVVVAGRADEWLHLALGLIAIAVSSATLVAGFVVTRRALADSFEGADL